MAGLEHVLRCQPLHPPPPLPASQGGSLTKARATYPHLEGWVQPSQVLAAGVEHSNLDRPPWWALRSCSWPCSLGPPVSTVHHVVRRGCHGVGALCPTCPLSLPVHCSLLVPFLSTSVIFALLSKGMYRVLTANTLTEIACSDINSDKIELVCFLLTC